MTDPFEQLSLTELDDVGGGMLSPEILSMAYRSLGKMSVLAPAPETGLGRGPGSLFQPNPYIESLRNAVTTQFTAPSNPGSSG